MNLRGFDPSGTPVTAVEATRSFLEALAIAPENVPASPEAQAGLYRSLVAQRQMLIVVDNARDEQQIRSLLPASPGTLVLITSRNQLDGLAATNGAQLLTVDVISHHEARELLSARIGLARAAAEPAAVNRIVEMCGCLPLALAVAAAYAAARPRMQLAALADELRDSPAGLDALDSADPEGSVRADFSWSYQQLNPDTARLFRPLRLHPGPDIAAPAAVGLGAIPPDRARQHRGELTRAHLITEQVPGRYAFHDLLRAFDQYYEAVTLSHLGDTLEAAGDLPQAQVAWRRALAIFEDLQHPDASQVRVKLARTDRQTKAGSSGNAAPTC